MSHRLESGTLTCQPQTSRIAGTSSGDTQEAMRRSMPWLWRWAFVSALIASCALAAPDRALAQSSAPMSTSLPGGLQGVAPVQAATSSTTPLANQSMLYPGEDFQLAPGDLIAVRVFMQEYSQTVRLGLDGSVQLPFIGSVVLDGLTVRAAQTLIADRLRAAQFYRNPEVTIEVLESLNGSVTIAGEVKAVVPITGARRLIDVLSAAGGLPATASHTVKIVRPGVAEPIVVNLGTDMAASDQADRLVYPRDIIQVARAGVVYVLGAFAHQGAVPLDQATPLTLLQLTALSGGIGFEGQYGDLRLIRTVGIERKVVEVDIKKVRDGKAPDPVLQANDIVFLPTNAMKAALKNLGTGGVLGLVTVLIAAHPY
jgi:polysaccharide export outer membrane protein